MIIGYDGKRAFQNKTGLGNYSRSLVSILARYFRDNRYLLFTPHHTDLFETNDPIEVLTPSSPLYKRLPGLWRRRGMVKDIVQSGCEIFHGLSNELPQGLEKTSVKKIVTVHDLVFERFPETYHFDERYTHRWKVKHACKVADVVIAISQQTKDDLVNYYHIAPEKIVVCYQSCNPIFEKMASPVEKDEVKRRYALPNKYFLFVSSITARKNLITICKSLFLLKGKLDIPLVVIGNGKREKKEATDYMAGNGMAEKLIILNELPQSKEMSFTSAADFPAIYQQATALIYPSIFEGFGLPVLEALWSGTPVISGDQSSMPEVGGNAALYFSPLDHQLLAQHMIAVATDDALTATLRTKGLAQAKLFNSENYANKIMEVYNRLV